MAIKFYRTFGTVAPARSPQRRVWLWLALLLTVVALYGLATLVGLMLSSFRAEFENTRLPPYGKNLSLALSAPRFQTGQTALLSIAIANPADFAVSIEQIEITLPPRFLDAFTVDDNRCRVERRADASGAIRCPAAVLPGQGKLAFDIPLQASQAGNYQGTVRLVLRLVIPLAGHPWYISTDADNQYHLQIERALAPEFRIVPKP